MDTSNHPRSPFEALYGELWDSLNRFDSMMQQNPFGSSFWWRPSSLLQGRPGSGDAIEAQQQRQSQQYPALQQNSGRSYELSPWSGAMLHSPHSNSGWFGQNSCVPRMDLRDAGDKLLLHADIPGMDKNDVKVEAHDGRLSIHAHRSSKNERGDGNWYMQERCSSSFYRSFPLPPETQQEGIKATYNNGVLEVSIPKTASSPSAPSKTINVE